MKKWCIKSVKWIAALLVFGFVLYFLIGVLLSDKQVKRYKAEVMLAELESAMSRYQIDFGYYPQWDCSDEDGAGLLFQELMKRSDKVQYLRESFPTSDVGGKTRLIDVWGNPFRYRIDPPDIDPEKRKAKNPTYDLWSTAGRIKDQSKWITNWKSH